MFPNICLRVVWRFCLIVIIDFVFAILLSFACMIKVDFAHENNRDIGDDKRPPPPPHPRYRDRPEDVRGKAGLHTKMLAHDAHAWMHDARGYFGLLHRAAYSAALGLGYTVRALTAERDHSRARQHAATPAVLRVLVGLDGPPFAEPPGQAVPFHGGRSVE